MKRAMDFIKLLESADEENVYHSGNLTEASTKEFYDKNKGREGKSLVGPNGKANDNYIVLSVEPKRIIYVSKVRSISGYEVYMFDNVKTEKIGMSRDAIQRLSNLAA